MTSVKKINNLLCIKLPSEFLIIRYQDICMIKANGNYTELILTNPHRKYLISKSMSQISVNLDKDIFVQCNRSVCTNLSYINNVLTGANTSVVMSDGSRIRVSRRRKKNVLGKISDSMTVV